MVDKKNLTSQRNRAVKTAIALAVVAVLIFIAFILSGVLAS